MKQLVITLLVVFIILETQAGEKKDSVTVSGSVLVMHNGVASVPAFTLGEPAILASLAVKRKGFSYEPVATFDLTSMRPWFWDHWMRYTFEANKVPLSTRIGVTWSTFFQKYAVVGNSDTDDVHEAVHYLVTEFRETWTTNRGDDLEFIHWYNFGVSQRTIDGHFLSIVYVHTLDIKNVIEIGIHPSIFYINFTGKNDGLFVSNVITLQHKKVPLNLGFQSIQKCWTNFDTQFEWSLFLNYDF